jgi:hypothetical protein
LAKLVKSRFLLSHDAAVILVESAEDELNATCAQVEPGFPTLAQFLRISRRISSVGGRGRGIFVFQPKAKSKMNGLKKPFRTTQEMSIKFFKAWLETVSLKILTIPFYFLYI